MRSKCKVEGCDRDVTAKGYCGAHYRRSKTGKPMSDPIVLKVHGGQVCTIEGCGRRMNANGLCSPHEQRRRKGSPLEPPIRRRRANGEQEWRRDSSGYVVKQRTVDGRQVNIRQHRVVMEEMLGRPLLPHETPHHKNGVRHDNRPENLELWSKSQPAGQRVKDKLAWAREIIALYEKDEDKL